MAAGRRLATLPARGAPRSIRPCPGALAPVFIDLNRFFPNWRLVGRPGVLLEIPGWLENPPVPPKGCSGFWGDFGKYPPVLRRGFSGFGGPKVAGPPATLRSLTGRQRLKCSRAVCQWGPPKSRESAQCSPRAPQGQGAGEFLRLQAAAWVWGAAGSAPLQGEPSTRGFGLSSLRRRCRQFLAGSCGQLAKNPRLVGRLSQAFGLAKRDFRGFFKNSPRLPGHFPCGASGRHLATGRRLTGRQSLKGGKAGVKGGPNLAPQQQPGGASPRKGPPEAPTASSAR
ncbi:hypothetical protein HUJ04_000239 [Dendroctonus ponderosae]|nr:hypothetical protein HUJ04_000239 [Dendroctonus ponderosae]